MADELNTNNQTTDVDLDKDLNDSNISIDSAPKIDIPVITPKQPENTQTQKGVDLNNELEQLEKNYKAEISNNSNLAEQSEKLGKIKTEIENNIKNREETIKVELAELHNLKSKIENEIKKVNELKEADKEIDADIIAISELENDRLSIEEKIKNLEEKLKGLV